MSSSPVTGGVELLVWSDGSRYRLALDSRRRTIDQTDGAIDQESFVFLARDTLVFLFALRISIAYALMTRAPTGTVDQQGSW